MRPYREHMQAAGRRYWLELLMETDDNVSRAARIAQVNRQSVYTMLRKLGIPTNTRSKRWHRGNWAEHGL